MTLIYTINLLPAVRPFAGGEGCQPYETMTNTVGLRRNFFFPFMRDSGKCANIYVIPRQYSFFLSYPRVREVVSISHGEFFFFFFFFF